MTKEGGGGGELLGQVLGQPGSRPNYVNLLGTLSELPNFSGPLCPNKEHDRAGFVPPQSLLCSVLTGHFWPERTKGCGLGAIRETTGLWPSRDSSVEDTRGPTAAVCHGKCGDRHTSVAARGGGRSRVLSGAQMLLPLFTHGLWCPRAPRARGREGPALQGSRLHPRDPVRVRVGGGAV